MTIGDIIEWTFRVLAALGLPAIILYYLKERRKNSAESEVAERTVDSTVAKLDLAAVEAQLSTLRDALEMERQSKNNLITDLREQLMEARATIADLRLQVATLTQRLASVEQRQGGAEA